MDLLRAALPAVLATACYAPDVRDCTVACTAAADCAPSQLCGSDGFCAAEDLAGRCASIASPSDAGTRTDAGSDAPVDAKPAPDAWPTVMLHVRIDGRGSVSIPTVGTCDGGSGQTACPFVIEQNVALTLHATPKNNWRFERWSEACDGEPSTTCTVTAATSTSVRVLFVDDDGDDDDAL